MTQLPLRTRVRWLLKSVLRRLSRFVQYLKFRVGKTERIQLDKASPALKRDLIGSIPPAAGTPFEKFVVENNEVWRLCTRAKSETGFWPISFSYPREMKINELSYPEALICPIVPGDQYRFFDESEYLRHYGKYAFALTHKKGGWDCFRHLEVIFSGALPFMPDASRIPPFTMAHYPKRQMSAIADHLKHSGDFPDLSLRQDFAEYFNSNLTCSAMSRYLMRAIGADEQSKILFFDRSLPNKPDYLSVLTLIGLKQSCGDNAYCLFPVDYVFDDWSGDPPNLYGRGFGYVKSLPASYKNASPNSGSRAESVALESDWDYVIVGNVSANAGSLRSLSERYGPKKLVLLDGGDKAFEIEPYALQEMSSHVFVRELAP